MPTLLFHASTDVHHHIAAATQEHREATERAKVEEETHVSLHKLMEDEHESVRPPCAHLDMFSDQTQIIAIDYD